MLPKLSPAAEVAWEAGMEAIREARRQKLIEDQLRLLPRRRAVAEYLKRRPGASLLEIARNIERQLPPPEGGGL